MAAVTREHRAVHPECSAQYQCTFIYYQMFITELSKPVRDSLETGKRIASQSPHLLQYLILLRTREPVGTFGRESRVLPVPVERRFAYSVLVLVFTVSRTCTAT